MMAGILQKGKKEPASQLECDCAKFARAETECDIMYISVKKRKGKSKAKKEKKKLCTILNGIFRDLINLVYIYLDFRLVSYI